MALKYDKFKFLTVVANKWTVPLTFVYKVPREKSM